MSKINWTGESGHGSNIVIEHMVKSTQTLSYIIITRHGSGDVVAVNPSTV